MTSSSSNPPRRLGEFAMIAKLFAPLAANNPGALGLSDDAATVQVPSDQELVVTKDMLVEGVHFLRDDPPDLLAKKALRVNLSDLAAKGATPRNYLLGLSLAPWIGDEWLTRFAAGLAEDQKRFAVTLSGGDTTASSGPLTISITALGSVPLGRMIRRKGARPRDAVFVTGTIGDAGAGLAVLKGEGVGLSDFNRSALISRYQLPEPRVALGRQLLGIASSALDVSDGLVADLGHIAKVSEARIAIDAAKIPVSAATQALWGQSQEMIVRSATSGDDYELAFTAPASARSRLEELSKSSGVAITEIGRVEGGSGIHLLDEKGKPIAVPRAGFTHF
jgi:thiamine-monophosphate kinase